MSKVVLSFSMSLDGYAAGLDVSMRHAMGVGGERLHQWMFPDGAKPHPTDAAQVEKTFSTVGATIVGRRTYDVGMQHWNDTPFPVPSFVLTHNTLPEQQMKSASFRFVDDVTTAVRLARDAAGDKNVIVMGAATAQQVLRAGLADALHIQIVSVLLAGGVRLFDRIGDARIELVRTAVTAGSPDVTHLEFNVIN